MIMSHFLRHLYSDIDVDAAIRAEEQRVVILRFGRDGDTKCMHMDKVLATVQKDVVYFACIYVVDIDNVPDYQIKYELYGQCTIMFFFRNKHIKVDFGTGKNIKIHWALTKEREFASIVESVFQGARRGTGVVVSAWNFWTRFIY